jgi:hypothetical protein
MTFFSVIEYGIVSYIHRYNERNKKKFEKLNKLNKQMQQAANSSANGKRLASNNFRNYIIFIVKYLFT